MSLSRLWAFLAVALPALGAVIANLVSVDLTYHLRAGADILANRAIPTVDTWTFTAAGAPWADQQWGAQAILAAVFGVGGWTGLVVLRAALTAVVFGCLYLVARRRGLAEREAALLVLAGFAVSAVALGLRPQLLGMAVFAVILVLVVDRRDHPRRLWAIPVLVAFWANLHGSFVLGPLVVGLAWLEDVVERRPSATRTLAVAIASAVAACITPFGPSVWAYAAGLSVNPQVTRLVTEWQPTSLRDAPGILFFASVAAVVVLLARRGRVTPWPTLASLGAFAALGTYAIRGVAWWPLGAVPAVAGLLAPDPASSPNAAPKPARAEPLLMRRLNVLVAGLLVLVGVALLPVWRPQDPDLRAPVGVVGIAPPGITAWLRDHAPSGSRVFAPQIWSSWFEFALPQLTVAVDSRIEVAPATVWDDYQTVTDGRDGWQAVLTSWNVDLVVLDEDQLDQAPRFEAAGWRVGATTAEGVVLTRG